MILLLIITNIFFWAIIIRLENIREKAKKISYTINCFDLIDKMLNKYNIPINTVKIEESKIYGYSPIYNSIRIANFESKKFDDILATLHETGHYVTINSNNNRMKVYKISQYIIAINRLVIVPLYLIFALGILLNINIVIQITLVLQEIMLLYFMISSFLKIIIYFPHEILASRKAKYYINEMFENSVINISKKLYALSFLSQAFLTIIVLLLIIYLNIEIMP